MVAVIQTGFTRLLRPRKVLRWNGKARPRHHNIPELLQDVQETCRYDRTALTEEQEFRAIYSLDVIPIPTNLPVIRIDHDDLVYKSKTGKFNAVVQDIIESNKKDSLCWWVLFLLKHPRC